MTPSAAPRAAARERRRGPPRFDSSTGPCAGDGDGDGGERPAPAAGSRAAERFRLGERRRLRDQRPGGGVGTTSGSRAGSGVGTAAGGGGVAAGVAPRPRPGIEGDTVPGGRPVSGPGGRAADGRRPARAPAPPARRTAGRARPATRKVSWVPMRSDRRSSSLIFGARTRCGVIEMRISVWSLLFAGAGAACSGSGCSAARGCR